MKDDNASERAAALLQQTIDVLQRAGNAPDSPVSTFVPGKMRRHLRRGVERLRRGEAQPKYKNLFTAGQLADIYEQTIRRDEIREQTREEFVRIGHEIGRAMREDGPGVRKAFETFFLETLRSAKEDGPDSEAAQRYRQLQSLVRLAKGYGSHKRRQKLSDPRVPAVPHDAEGRIPLIPAEILASLPSSGEAVIAIPPEGGDSGRGRMFLRIGAGEASWIGSFERGHMNVSTIFMMPDGKHLFVSAEGAGYVIEAKSRTLVEEIGTEVAGVMRDDPMTVFVVVHNSLSLEAFGKTGRLWKTDPIGCGGFRRMAITDTRLVGEARHPFRPGWAGFSVKLATGEVRFADGR
jgi:hypothetical protein